MFKKLVAGMLALGLFGSVTPASAQSVDLADPENTLFIDLPTGRVTVQMRPDKAPAHVARIKELVRRNFYDGLVFHRVIEGFMAQTGDVEFGDMEDGFTPNRAGTGGSSQPDIKAEFSDRKFVRGTVGMARSMDPDSANSQFFIMFAPAPHLNGQYTVVGKVVSGMDVVDQIKRGTGQNGAVTGTPDVMKTVTVSE
jgi:peptidylprolyl isomerase